MDRFRALYHAAPGDVHAPASIYAVAELLAEQGRTLGDPKSLKAALGEYALNSPLLEFLPDATLQTK